MTDFLARALHIDSTDENKVIIPNQPLWDTLIGICNPFNASQDTVIHCYDTTGAEVPNSPLKYTLQPKHSFAMTFIKGNPFTDVPQNWQGYATIDFPSPDPMSPGMELPVAVCFGGNGPGLLNWNYSTPSVEVLNSSRRSFGSAARWVFPYCIPYFRDPTQHADEHEYRTGLAITNLGTTPVTLQIKYTVGDFYGNVGDQLTTQVTIDPGKTFVKQLHEILPGVLTMNLRTNPDGTPMMRTDGLGPEYEGSEGWIDITSMSGDSDLIMWLECANRDYNFLGFNQSPWMY